MAVISPEVNRNSNPENAEKKGDETQHISQFWKGSVCEGVKVFASPHHFVLTAMLAILNYV